MKLIGTLVEDGCGITLGPVNTIDCTATAADEHNTLAIRARRDDATHGALLKRLDRAKARVYEAVNEVNAASN